MVLTPGDRYVDDAIGYLTATWESQYAARVAILAASRVDLTPAPVPANCRNCGAPPTAGRDVCTYCDTPHGVVRSKVHRDAHDRTTPRRTLD